MNAREGRPQEGAAAALAGAAARLWAFLSMHPDLEHLIQLQELDLAAERARRRIAELPAARERLDARLAAREADVASVRSRIAASQAARRELEKELAAIQTRLSRYKDQLMEVKTNKEYQAMQKEIAVAESEVRGREDLLLERMEEGENLAADLKAAEAALRAEDQEVAAERRTLDAALEDTRQELEKTTADRSALAARIPGHALALFDHVSRARRGVALAEARDGHCMQCHVRLRPQIYNEVRRNDGLIQCDSCTRILYYVPSPGSAAAPSSPS